MPATRGATIGFIGGAQLAGAEHAAELIIRGEHQNSGASENPRLLDIRYQIEAIHSRHVHVCQEQLERAAYFGGAF